MDFINLNATTSAPNAGGVNFSDGTPDPQIGAGTTYADQSSSGNIQSPQTQTLQADDQHWYSMFTNIFTSSAHVTQTADPEGSQTVGDSYVPTVAKDGIEAVLAYNQKMLDTDTTAPIYSPAVALDPKTGTLDVSKIPGVGLAGNLSDSISSLFSEVKLGFILLLLFGGLIIYTVAKNTKINRVV